MTTDLKAVIVAVVIAGLFAAGVSLTGTRFRAGGELPLPVIQLGVSGKEAQGIVPAAPAWTERRGVSSVVCRSLAEFRESGPSGAPADPPAAQEISGGCSR